MDTKLASRKFVVCCLISLFLVGCVNTTQQRQRVHHAVAEGQSPPKKVVIIPVDITVKELSAGGVTEKVDTWTKTASTNVENALRAAISKREQHTLVSLPALNNTEQDTVEQYRALYEQVAYAAFTYGRQWKHKNERFDYTLGNGLDFLKKKTGADAALFTIGEDVVSTGGRKAVGVFLALLGANIRMGHSFLTVGLVSLETGDILWYNYDLSYADLDMREPQDAQKLVDRIAEGLDTLKDKKKAVVDTQ